MPFSFICFLIYCMCFNTNQIKHNPKSFFTHCPVEKIPAFICPLYVMNMPDEQDLMFQDIKINQQFKISLTARVTFSTNISPN